MQAKAKGWVGIFEGVSFWCLLRVASYKKPVTPTIVSGRTEDLSNRPRQCFVMDRGGSRMVSSDRDEQLADV
jgi:hypothetical protein